MLYSSHQKTLTKRNGNPTHRGLMDSSLKSQQVFDGNYWDDFALPLLMHRKAESALVLGVGYGAGFRSLLAVNPRLKITGIDNQAAGNETCRRLYSELFDYTPNLITADALGYLRESKENYDLIWVDLYDAEGLAPMTLTSQFWRNVSRRLNADGLVAVNIFGIANHLEPYVDQSPLKVVGSFLRREFSRVMVAPHRRNTTLIATHSVATASSTNAPGLTVVPEIAMVREHMAREQVVRPKATHLPLKRQEPLSEGLRFEDRCTLEVQMIRIKYLASFESDHRFHGESAIEGEALQSEPAEAFTFDRLNKEQAQSWGHFLYDLNQEIGRYLQVHFASPHALVEYLKNDTTGPQLFDALRDLKSQQIIMVPTFLGSDIHNHEGPFDWYFDYLRQNAAPMKEENPELWYNYFLPQWISMLNSREFLSGRIRSDLAPTLGEHHA